MQPLDPAAPVARRRDGRPAARSDHAGEEPAGVRREARHRLRLRDPRPRALPRQHVHGPQGPRRASSASSRPKILTAEQLGLSPAILEPVQAEQGAGARHRPDRLGQVDDALRDGRPHQQDARRITSSRSRTRSSSCTRTRSASSTSARCTRTPLGFKQRAARGAARGSGHRAGRRDARPRDDRDRDRDGGDGPPRVRHAAHDDRGVDGRPHHRSVPGRPAGADPRDAVGVAARASSRRRCARRSAAGASRRSRC